jgi:hypothetical protein
VRERERERERERSKCEENEREREIGSERKREMHQLILASNETMDCTKKYEFIT